MSGRAKAYAQRNPVVAYGAGAGGTIVAGVIAVLARFGIELQGAEVSLLVLVCGWGLVLVRGLMDRNKDD